MSKRDPIFGRPRVYLLDIEGTTSPVSLASEQLFPYARKHLGAYLQGHLDEPEMRADLEMLAEENRAEMDTDAPRMGDSGEAEEVLAYLGWLMDLDRKSTALKSMQGRIWKSGYEAGELVGTVFEDVTAALKRWSAEARVAIYSSGSVEAQKLIFGFSSAGDLRPLISAYFDTRIGPKTLVDSYRAITLAMGVETGEILFVSDLVGELDAAREAGCGTRLSVREGNQPVLVEHGHIAIRSFAEIP